MVAVEGGVVGVGGGGSVGCGVLVGGTGVLVAVGATGIGVLVGLGVKVGGTPVGVLVGVLVGVSGAVVGVLVGVLVGTLVGVGVLITTDARQVFTQFPAVEFGGIPGGLLQTPVWLQ